jgi:hypothetical protein
MVRTDQCGLRVYERAADETSVLKRGTRVQAGVVGALLGVALDELFHQESGELVLIMADDALIVREIAGNVANAHAL